MGSRNGFSFDERRGKSPRADHRSAPMALQKIVGPTSSCSLLCTISSFRPSRLMGKPTTLAGDKHLNVWIPGTFTFVCGNCSKPKICAFTAALRLRELLHVFFYL